MSEEAKAAGDPSAVGGRASAMSSFLQQLDQDNLLSEARTALEEEYLSGLTAAFNHATAATQDSIVPLLPPVERVRAMLWAIEEDRYVPRNSPSGSLRHIFGQVQRMWSEMVERLLYTESGATLLEDVAALSQHGQLLIQYLLQPVTYQSLDALLNTLREATIIGDDVLIDTEMQAVDTLQVWVLKAAITLYQQQYSDLNYVENVMARVFDHLAIDLDEYDDQLPKGRSTSDLLPQTHALLLPSYTAEQERMRSKLVEVAGRALRQRLRARRRLSAPLYLLPSSVAAAPGPTPLAFPGSAAGGLYLPPARGARQRRASRLPTVTPQSTSAQIRQFLQFQAEQEDAFVSLVGGARPNPGRPSRKRQALAEAKDGPMAAAAGAPSPLRNCERFAQKCDSETNLAGTGWCRIPPEFWWGPLLPGNKCYDIRELLAFNADRVVDVPGVRRAKTPAYPDGRPLSDNYLRTFVEIAKRNNHPVPEEIEIYLLGRRIQQRPRPELFSVGTTPRLRLIEQAPYGAVDRFQQQNARAVQERFAAAMRGNEVTAEEGVEEED